MKNPSKYFGNELKYVKKVLNSENWSATSGSWNRTLEIEFAKKVGVKYAIAMNSGTATLHCALKALGVGEGDEVITPALTVIMDTTAIFHANAIPVYCDVNPNTLCLDPEDLKKKITKKTKAIITVSLYGMPPDYDKIKEVACGIPIIEDNAQSLFNTYEERTIGNFGVFASYSFENTKLLSCGEGGILVTDNENLAREARKIAGHGFKNLQADEGRTRLNQDIFQDPNYKRHDSIGWNYRLSEVCAAVAMGQLEQCEKLQQLRIDSASIFLDVMKKYSVFEYQETDEYFYTHAYYTLGVKYQNEKYGIPWQKFRSSYIKNGGDGIYGAWAVPYQEPVIANETYSSLLNSYKDLNLADSVCPIAEKIQPIIMQFKTNYRDLKLAKEKAKMLETTIKELF
jgi:perosamine synthetase